MSIIDRNIRDGTAMPYRLDESKNIVRNFDGPQLLDERTIAGQEVRPGAREYWYNLLAVETAVRTFTSNSAQSLESTRAGLQQQGRMKDDMARKRRDAYSRVRRGIKQAKRRKSREEKRGNMY